MARRRVRRRLDARGRKLGEKLVEFAIAHPDLRHIRRFMLATSDAHGLYAKFGFTPLSRPERIMERYDPDALSR
jgi:predicted N-acetyltransferase YhbS